MLRHASEGNLFLDTGSAQTAQNYYAYQGQYLSGNYVGVNQYDYAAAVELDTVIDSLNSPDYLYDITLPVDFNNDGQNDATNG